MEESTIRILIDAGATKTHFVLLKDNTVFFEFALNGINANYSANEEIMSVFSEAVTKLPPKAKVTKIHYYGAGCATCGNATKIHDIIKLFFPLSDVIVNSDILAACRALSGNNPSIVCILGTGSTSCFYNGDTILKRAPSLGFLLGDEASGTCLGKSFVKEYLSGNLTDNVRASFEQNYSLSPEEVLNKLYQEPHPNRFLASVAPFVKKFEDDGSVKRIISASFNDFFSINKKYYPENTDTEWNFTGSIAENFKKHLMAAAYANNCKVGKVVGTPMPLLIVFHTKYPELS